MPARRGRRRGAGGLQGVRFEGLADVRPNPGAAEPRHRNYLVEAALAERAPSGTRYRDGAGRPLRSLGTLSPELVRAF